MTQKFCAVINLTNVQHEDEEVFRLNKSVSYVYNSKEHARVIATTQASKAPGTQFAVMEIVEVYEALQPTVIEKKFNDEGELLNVSKDETAL